MVIPSRISMILRASPHSSSPAAPRIDAVKLFSLKCWQSSGKNVQKANKNKQKKPQTPVFWKAAHPPVVTPGALVRCSLPEEPVLRAPHLRTFSPASAVTLVRNKPAAEVCNWNKGLLKGWGAGCWCSVQIWWVLGFFFCSGCCSASGSAAGTDETEVRARQRQSGKAAAAKRQYAGHLVAIYRRFFPPKLCGFT